MANKIEFITSVNKGKLSKQATEGIRQTLDKLEGKKCIISIEKLSAKRSEQQNKFIHVLLTAFTSELNALGNEFTMATVKDLCKIKFAMVDVVNSATGEVIGQEMKHTSAMNKIELNEFFEKIIRWASEDFDIQLFYPGEQLEIN